MASSDGGPSNATHRAAQEVERAKDDVVGAEGDGRAVWQDAGDLATRAPSERARFAMLTGGRVVDEHHPAERKEATQSGDLRARQRGHLGVAAPVEKRRVDDGRVVGADDGRMQSSGGARALHELPCPAPGRGRMGGPRLGAREENAGVECADVAEREGRARRSQNENERDCRTRALGDARDGVTRALRDARDWVTRERGARGWFTFPIPGFSCAGAPPRLASLARLRTRRKDTHSYPLQVGGAVPLPPKAPQQESDVRDCPTHVVKERP